MVKLEKKEMRLRETFYSAGISTAHSEQMAHSKKTYLEEYACGSTGNTTGIILLLQSLDLFECSVF